MDETTRERLLELAHRPLLQLTLADVGFVIGTLSEHPDEATTLVPDLAVLLDL